MPCANAARWRGRRDVVITFGLLAAPNQTCEPLAELKALLRAGRLPRLVSLAKRAPARPGGPPRPP